MVHEILTAYLTAQGKATAVQLFIHLAGELKISQRSAEWKVARWMESGFENRSIRCVGEWAIELSA